MGDDVADDFFGIGLAFFIFEAASAIETDGDGRVEVAAGNVTDGVSHGEDGETEGQCNADVMDGVVTSTTSEQSRTAAAENKPECADTLGDRTLR